MLLLDKIFISQKEDNRTWKILNDFSLSVEAGDNICLIGEEGSGLQELFSCLRMKEKAGYIFGGEISIEGGRKVAHLSLDLDYNDLEGTPKQLLKTLTFRHPDKEKIRDLYPTQLIKWDLDPEIIKTSFKNLSRFKARMCYYAIVCVLAYDIIFIDNVNNYQHQKYLQVLIESCKKATIIFASNNLSGIKFSKITYILYGGEVIEMGKAEEILYNSRHPYVWSLLTSLAKKNIQDIDVSFGYLPKITPEVNADVYSSRNKYALEIDFEAKPPWQKISNTHYVRTWLEDERAKGLVKPPPHIIQRRQHFKEHYEHE